MRKNRTDAPGLEKKWQTGCSRAATDTGYRTVIRGKRAVADIMLLFCNGFPGANFQGVQEVSANSRHPERKYPGTNADGIVKVPRAVSDSKRARDS
jgi:hypothetical protein